jgi:uncharacterized phage infection (PIP) family protein YhgE
MEQRVNTNDLGVSAKAVTNASDSVTSMRDTLLSAKDIPFHLGNFAEAVELRNKIASTVGAYADVTTRLRDDLYRVGRALDQTATGAEQTEQGNRAIAGGAAQAPEARRSGDGSPAGTRDAA